jgi:hypothetical protein
LLSPQSDLGKAASNQNTNGIFVYYHKTAYSTTSKAPPYAKFREIYHPLFDKYRVDLVLQGHEHTYQRAYHMGYNVNNSFNPKVTDNANSHNYTNPQGRIFTIVGTAGAPSISIVWTLSLHCYSVYMTRLSGCDYEK